MVCVRRRTQALAIAGSAALTTRARFSTRAAGAASPDDAESWQNAIRAHIRYWGGVEKDSYIGVEPSESSVDMPSRAFISYRQKSDKELARSLVDKLGLQVPPVLTVRAPQSNPRSAPSKLADLLSGCAFASLLAQWWDQNDLPYGEEFAEQFVNGLLTSNIYVPIISKEGIADLVDLREDSDWIDNFFLEMRLALELRERGDMLSIFPVFVGELEQSREQKIYHSFHAAQHKGLPACQDAAVAKVEAKVQQILEAAGKDTRLQCSGRVRQVLERLTKVQGYVFEGNQAKEIEAAVRELTAEFRKVQGLKSGKFESTRLSVAESSSSPSSIPSSEHAEGLAPLPYPPVAPTQSSVGGLVGMSSISSAGSGAHEQQSMATMQRYTTAMESILRPVGGDRTKLSPDMLQRYEKFERKQGELMDKIYGLDLETT